MKKLSAADMLLPRLGGMTFQPNRLLLRVLSIRTRIDLREGNPLDALITETHYRAYLVANLALAEQPDIATKVPLLVSS